jgi:hypothetical protein
MRSSKDRSPAAFLLYGIIVHALAVSQTYPKML